MAYFQHIYVQQSQTQERLVRDVDLGYWFFVLKSLTVNQTTIEYFLSFISHLSLKVFNIYALLSIFIGSSFYPNYLLNFLSPLPTFLASKHCSLTICAHKTCIVTSPHFSRQSLYTGVMYSLAISPYHLPSLPMPWLPVYSTINQLLQFSSMASHFLSLICAYVRMYVLTYSRFDENYTHYLNY